MKKDFDLVIIGAGPAGMSAAIQASKFDMKTLVLDDQLAIGGQVYRHIMQNSNKKKDLSFLDADYWSGQNLAYKFLCSSIQLLPESRVWQITKNKEVFFTQKGKTHCVQAKSILIATGAMERPMPVKGWTLPGVMTVGGAQILLKTTCSGADGAVFAGSGPLFYLTIQQYLRAGFEIKAVIDTRPKKMPLMAYIWAFPSLLQPRLLLKGIRWYSEIRKQSFYFSNVNSIRIVGKNVAESLCFKDAEGREQRTSAKHIFIHQGVIPNINLTMATELKHRWCRRQLCWKPKIDMFGESSIEGIFVAGDSMGIGGAEAAVFSGKIAIQRIAEKVKRSFAIKTLILCLYRWRQLAIRPFLDYLFKPPEDWLVPEDDTAIICRCESLSKSDISNAIKLGVAGPNQLKSFCRAGMGRCQGRLCGLTIQKMIANHHGQSEEKVGYYRLRPPIRPLTVFELATLSNDDSTAEK